MNSDRLKIPQECRAAVFDGAGRPFRIATFPLVAPPPGHILARIRMATICGSDLHTVSGRRTASAPLILGHEMVAEIAALGDGVLHSASGKPLQAGDRISFTIMAGCGQCRNCAAGMPQKCESLLKYGHTSCDAGFPLSGGFAEYIYLRPGTHVFHAPVGLSDKEVCPANCALATAVNGLEAISAAPGERALIQGAGLVGLYSVALLRERGISEIVVTDISDGRLDIARSFGADEVLNVAGMDDEQVVQMLGTDRFSVAVEACGNPDVVWPAVRTLRLKGRYLIIGMVAAGSMFAVDGDTIARRYLTITGVHNYAPQHLAKGLDMLQRTKLQFPYDGLVSDPAPLADIGNAFQRAAEKAAARVALAPCA